MDETELARIGRLVHAMCCRDRLSPELAGQRLAAYGLDLDAGAIGELLERSACQHCAASPRQATDGPEPVRAVVHQATVSGQLTGMIDRD